MTDHVLPGSAADVGASLACPECESVVVDGQAPWCGSCGALLRASLAGASGRRPRWASPDDPLAPTPRREPGDPLVVVTSAPRGVDDRAAPQLVLSITGDGEPVAPPPGRRLRTGATVVGLVAVAAIAAGPTDPGAPTDPASSLVDVGPGTVPTVVSSTPVGSVPTSPLAVSIGDGAVSLRGGPVVSDVDGRVLRAAGVGPAAQGRVVSSIAGDQLVHEDLLSGRMLGRHAVALDAGGRTLELLGRGGGGIVATAGDDLVGLDTDGTPRWRVVGAAGEHVRVTPGADWAIGTTGGGSTVLVRDLRDGSIAWSLRAPGEPSIASSARLVAPPDGAPLVVLVDGDEVVGRDPTDGAELWRVRPVEPQDPAAPSALRLADAHDVVAVLVARMSEGSSRILQLDPETGRVRTRVFGPVPTSPLALLDGRWAVDARGAAVIGGHGVTTTLWRRDPNLALVDDVLEVGLAGDALVLVRAGITPTVEVRDRGDHEVLASIPVVPG